MQAHMRYHGYVNGLIKVAHEDNNFEQPSICNFRKTGENQSKSIQQTRSNKTHHPVETESILTRKAT